MNASSRSLANRRCKERYGLVFLLGFLSLFVILLPLMIYEGGYFIYYGDFNSQQIPFYHLAHDAVRDGSFGWNWNTDLGSNFIGSYSFYLLGSPFFWLTIPFPSAAVPYLMPWLLCLKHGCAALTAYAFMRRFVRTRESAMIGALLYAFSGFQAYNIFFNHFQDVTAFFPLLLIALEERVNNNRRGVFGLAVALMAVINYFFFTGQVVFVLLYFIFRCFCKDFHITWRKFFGIALESVLGVLLAAGMLLPSAMAILENGRVTERLYGLDMVTYSDRTRLLRIVQSFFMVPDVPARPNLLNTEYGKWASIGGYLPLFSMAGVLAFLRSRKQHWASRLTLLCILCAMIPILNAAFYTFNGSYYARWFYMPILIMALMTAIALDDVRISMRSGVITCGVTLLLFGAMFFIPIKDKDKGLRFFDFANYPLIFWLDMVACIACLVVLILLLRRRKKARPYRKLALVSTVFSCIVCTALVVYFGVSNGPYPNAYIDASIKGGEKITLEDEENQFYRVDISENYDNFPMLWGYPNMRCFQSIVPASIMDFYDTVGVTRDVASRAGLEHYTLRGLFSVKYYFDRVINDPEKPYTYDIKLPGFKYRNTQNGFYVYENEYYVPMGFTYDNYVLDSELEKRSNMAIEKQLLRNLVLTEEQAETYSSLLTHAENTDGFGLSEADYLKAAEERRAHSCDTFTKDAYSFRATITLEQPNLVFFSVPYEKGWSATVNGKEVPVERVNYGFVAVPAEAGDNVIEFHYATPGLALGAKLSLGGGILLLLYLLWGIRQRKREAKQEILTRHSYDYAVSDTLPIKTAYEVQLLRRIQQSAKEETPHAPTGNDPDE